MEGIATQLVYLLGFYWPYLAGALAIGAVTGWLSYSRKKA